MSISCCMCELVGCVGYSFLRTRAGTRLFASGWAIVPSIVMLGVVPGEGSLETSSACATHLLPALVDSSHPQKERSCSLGRLSKLVRNEQVGVVYAAGSAARAHVLSLVERYKSVLMSPLVTAEKSVGNATASPQLAVGKTQLRLF